MHLLVRARKHIINIIATIYVYFYFNCVVSIWRIIANSVLVPPRQCCVSTVFTRTLTFTPTTTQYSLLFWKKCNEMKEKAEINCIQYLYIIIILIHASFHFNVKYNQVLAKSNADCKTELWTLWTVNNSRAATKKQHYKSNKRHIILYYALCTVYTSTFSSDVRRQTHTHVALSVQRREKKSYINWCRCSATNALLW